MRYILLCVFAGLLVLAWIMPRAQPAVPQFVENVPPWSAQAPEVATSPKKNSAQKQAPTADKSGAAKLQAMRFPESRTFGILFDHGAPHTNNEDWPLYAAAKGLVEYPESSRFHLEVSEECAGDLGPLNALPPDAIQSLRLPAFDMSERNIAALRHLTGVRLIQIDNAVSDVVMKKLRDTLGRSTTTTCRQQPCLTGNAPAPPIQHVLSFSEDNSIGLLAIRPWKQLEQQWQQIGEARGKVTIPKAMEVKLTISEGLSDISAFKGLFSVGIHTLVLKGSDITDESMIGPAFLRGITALEMDSTAVTDTGMAKLTRNVGLQELKLINTRIGDEGIEVLKRTPRLERVYIDGAPNITGQSLNTFRALRGLRRLHLANTAVSTEKLTQLARDMDACAITPAM